MVDEAGEVRLNRSYEPYGEVMASDGEVETDYAFTGENYDPQTGLIYLRSRNLSLSTGRFISKDSWPGDYYNPTSLNRWNYVEGNPVNFIDPGGMWRW